MLSPLLSPGQNFVPVGADNEILHYADGKNNTLYSFSGPASGICSLKKAETLSR